MPDELRKDLSDPLSADVNGVQGATGSLDPSRRFRWVIFVPLVLVLVPVFVGAGRREVARWYQALAIEADFDRQVQQAMSLAESGLRWDPDNILLRIQLVGWRLSDGTAGDALEDADLAVQAARKEARTAPNVQNQLILASALNTSAYTRALAGVEWDRAKEQIDDAIRLSGSDLASGLAGMLDTRGYVNYLLGDLPAALDDMEQAVKLMESDIERQLAQIRLQRDEEIDPRPSRQLEQDLRETRAVLYHHRGLVYRALGRSGEADADLRHAKELGYDPKSGVW
ncbi:MAG TPA: hypothetical protein VIY86_14065 [Pirellulaceae bacterium]